MEAITTVHEFPMSEEKTVFTGSSPEDKAYAKTFWQSVNLQPTLESRLVSSDIRQRLKVAPPGGQKINVTYVPVEDPPQLQEYFTDVYSKEQMDRVRRMQRHAHLREENLQILSKRKHERFKKEEISRGKGIQNKNFDFPDTNYDDNEDVDCMDSLRQLDEFDSKNGGHNSDSD